MTQENVKPTRRKPVQFTIGYDGKPEQTINAVLHAFDAKGRLLASAPLRDGMAQLDLSPEQLQRARLFVAPELPQRSNQPVTLKSMTRLHAYEPTWRFERGREQYELLPIPSVLWPWWHWCSCRVRGRVIKVETLGGVTYEKPVCNAHVRICEVDRLPWIIAKLPDDIIYRLRDELVRAIENPIPVPPVPPVVFEPGFGDTVPVFARAAAVFGAPGSTVALNPQPLPPRAMMLQFESRAALMSGSTTIVREALINQVELIKSYWCHWHWLRPWFHYVCDDLTVVQTDDNGHFDTTIWYPCSGDKPDLYFRVDVAIGEVWTNVYAPTVRCHTYWNYSCGSEVTIRVTDPRVHGCGERPELVGKKLVVKTIGRQVSMGEIYRASVVPSDHAKQGQVKEGWIDPTKPSPFGATIEPRVDFGDGLTGAGITHYRWSQRSLGSVSEADWAVIDTPVARHYREATPPLSPTIYKSLQIGPDTSVPGYYTQIDPALPAGGEDWEILDEGYDLASAYCNTDGLTAGKYELKLELFRKVGVVMSRVDLTAEGVELYEITDPAPLVAGAYTTVAAADDRLLIDSGSGHAVGYRLVLHIDNRPCFGDILDVTVNGIPAGRCGFLEYSATTDAAQIAFRASHPANFASFTFRVVRVSTSVNEATASGLVDAASVPDAAGSAVAFVRSGDTFSKTVTVDTLLTSGLPAGETPCTRAAFAEALHVYALATNGYGRLSQYDGPGAGYADLKAFAITRE